MYIAADHIIEEKNYDKIIIKIMNKFKLHKKWYNSDNDSEHNDSLRENGIRMLRENY